MIQNFGISLGNNISPIIANMALDGLQKRLYELQGDKVSDYKNGCMVRFADDIIVFARSIEDARKFQQTISDFVYKRGLRLKMEKTKIVNVKTGFDFLSRFYVKIDKKVRVLPSDSAVQIFEQEVMDFILNPEKNWTQRTLIKELNAKLYGFATYHRVEEAGEAFYHLDTLVNATLLKLMQNKYPNRSMTQLRNEFWYKMSDGRYVFSYKGDRNYAVMNLNNTILVKHPKLDIKKNIFLDVDYFTERDIILKIDKMSANYKKIWQRQSGRCFFCGEQIAVDDRKKLIQIDLSKKIRLNNLAYIHTRCENSEIMYIDTNLDNVSSRNIQDIFKDIDKMEEKKKTTKIITKVNKYKPLYDYFNRINKKTFTLSISNIEEILNFKLCKSAYKFKTFWNNESNFVLSWKDNNYEIIKINLEKQTIKFMRKGKKTNKLEIPDIVLNSNLSENAISEIRTFFEYIIKKYGLD